MLPEEARDPGRVEWVLEEDKLPMLEATQRARMELHHLRQIGRAGADDAVRVARDDAGSLSLSVDAVRPDDVVIADSGTPLLIANHRAANLLKGSLLHYRSDGDDRYGPRGFALLQRRGTSVRAAA